MLSYANKIRIYIRIYIINYIYKKRQAFQLLGNKIIQNFFLNNLLVQKEVVYLHYQINNN